MLVIPKILESCFSVNDELNYHWNEKTSSDYYFNYINEKLSKALWSLNHKATVGLATALSEWVLWRLIKVSKQDLSWEITAIEAMWAGIIDKHYIKEWNYESDIQIDKVKGPLWVVLNCMDDIRYNYLEGDIFINAKVSTIAAIARLITPDTLLFDDWLTSCVKKSAKLFSVEYDRNECNNPNEYYNSSHELPIPREFYFDPAFDYSTENVDELLAAFVSSLDYKKNEFLNSPEVMIENGYTGIPYEYKKK